MGLQALSDAYSLSQTLSLILVFLVHKYQNKNGIPTGVFLSVFNKHSIEVAKCFSISKIVKFY